MAILVERVLFVLDSTHSPLPKHGTGANGHSVDLRRQWLCRRQSLHGKYYRSYTTAAAATKTSPRRQRIFPIVGTVETAYTPAVACIYRGDTSWPLVGLMAHFSFIYNLRLSSSLFSLYLSLYRNTVLPILQHQHPLTESDQFGWPIQITAEYTCLPVPSGMDMACLIMILSYPSLAYKCHPVVSIRICHGLVSGYLFDLRLTELTSLQSICMSAHMELVFK